MWTPFPDELAEIAGLTDVVHDPERAVLAGRSLGSDIYTSLDVKIGALAKIIFRWNLGDQGAWVVLWPCMIVCMLSGRASRLPVIPPLNVNQGCIDIC